MVYEDFVNEAAIDADYTDEQIETMLDSGEINMSEAGFLHGYIAV